MRKLIEQLYHRPWFATIGVYQSVKTLVEAKLEDRTPEKLESMEDFFTQRTPLSVEPGGIAIIDISGVLGRRLSKMEKTCGACDYGDVMKEIAAAKAQAATGYMFLIDSGGGMASGCAECANAIASLEAPTFAFVDGMAASAAYYLASACDMIMASPSASVGSIGVILPWIDSSRLMEFSGLRSEPIVNQGADYKAIGFNPSLTEGQRAYLQSEVNAMGKAFRDFVTSKRPQIDEEVFKAGTYFGERALELGLIDMIDSLPEAQKLLRAEVDMSQRAKFMGENTNQPPAVTAQAHLITDPGHTHMIDAPSHSCGINDPGHSNTGQTNFLATSGGVVPTTTTYTMGTAQPVYATAVELNDLRTQISLLVARCQNLESSLMATQKMLAGLPDSEKVQETVDKRFAAHEAARGHIMPIRQPQESAPDPLENARIRTRTNPDVIKVLERIGHRS